MPVHLTTGKITLNHPQGASVEILLYGATITSWRSPSLDNSEVKERLFLSSKAILDGTKAVRGGIPVVFPCFGPPQHPDHLSLAQHGFARTSVWTFERALLDDNAGVSVRLVLEPTPEIAALYSKPFKLAYVVTLAQHQLSTDIHVTNPSGDSPLEFQSLLHTYIRAPADQVSITPLENIQYFDKMEPTAEAQQAPKVESRTEVDVRVPTDSVYENASGHYTVTWPGHHVDIRAKGFKDVVVWNPGEDGKKIGDMEDGGWNHYVCVEPGFVRGFVNLAPGASWIGQQVLTIRD